ncbi:MAG: hypothetical protein PHV06_02790 [bacterium]|nr:hypothetical protein [bacterium]
MKISGIGIISLSIFLIICTPAFSEFQPDFDTFEIVMEKTNDSWNSKGPAGCFILFDEGMYRMWFTGRRGPVDNRNYFSIGYADSKDGVHWENIKLLLECYDYNIFYSPCVIFEGDKYKIYFSGYYIDILNQWAHYIALSESTKGVDIKSPLTVLTGTGNYNDFDGRNVRTPFVCKNENKYIMYYVGGKAYKKIPENQETFIASVESEDGKHWNDRRIIFSENDLFHDPNHQSWLFSPSIMKNENGTQTMLFSYSFYFKFYNKDISCIFASDSKDGENWSKPYPVLQYPEIKNINQKYSMTSIPYPFVFQDPSGKVFLYFSVYNEKNENLALARIELKNFD